MSGSPTMDEVIDGLLAFETNTEVAVFFGREGVVARLLEEHAELPLDGPALEVMNAFAGPDRRDKILDLVEREGIGPVAATLEELIDAGLIREASSVPATWSDRFGDFGTAAWALHVESRDVKYALNLEEQDEVLSKVYAQKPPDIYKCSCTSDGTLALPEPAVIPAKSLTSVYFARRTCRHFLPEQVSLQDLATVVFHAAGAVYELVTENFGPVLMKAAPSPGGRHGTELYFVAQHVEGLEPAIYHYCVKHHAVNRVGTHDPDFVRDALMNQHYFNGASVIFFFSYVRKRVTWKYPSPRVYRLIHYETGHYCQNLVLAGTALGLGVYQTGALADSLIEERLGIDGADEYVMYAAGIGHADPDAQPDPQLTQLRKLPGGIEPNPHKLFVKYLDEG